MAAADRAPVVVRSAGPEPEPVAVPECDVCQSCDRERESARRDERSLTVRSCNAVIAGHPHGREVRGDHD